MKTSAFDPLGSLTWQSLMSQGDKVTFLILYSFNRLIIISSDGKQAILTVNNLPRPQGTGLGNAGNNGEKLKIVPIIYYHQVKGEKNSLWKYIWKCSFTFPAKPTLNTSASSKNREHTENSLEYYYDLADVLISPCAFLCKCCWFHHLQPSWIPTEPWQSWRSSSAHDFMM